MKYLKASSIIFYLQAYYRAVVKGLIILRQPFCIFVNNYSIFGSLAKLSASSSSVGI